jgi:hypothetical protein
MEVLPTDRSVDQVELHQATADGEAVHVKAKPQALANMWATYGTVEAQADGSQVLAIDGASR